MVREIHNGDSRLILPTYPDECVDGVFTDPPFNIDLTPQRGTHGQIANDALSSEDFQQLLDTVVGECYRLLRPNRVAWFCCNWQCYAAMELAAEKAGFEVGNCVVWVKNNFGLGYYFRPQHEFILFCTKGTPPVPPDSPSNVWEEARLVNTIHPNEKPVKLIQRALSLYNKEGDVILDPFSGSFATCAAAKSMGMGYIGVEVLPEFFTNGKQRLESGTVAAVNAKGKVVYRDDSASLLEMFNE